MLLRSQYTAFNILGVHIFEIYFLFLAIFKFYPYFRYRNMREALHPPANLTSDESRGGISELLAA